MSNGHGGARPGAGQKKKPLVEKVLDGNPGKRKLTVVEFPSASEFHGVNMPLPREMLSAVQKDGKPLIKNDSRLSGFWLLASVSECLIALSTLAADVLNDAATSG